MSSSTARDITGPSACVGRLGEALLLACPDDETSAKLLTGNLIVSISAGTGDARKMARSLRPLGAAAPRELPPPKPFSCRELERIPERYVRRVPKRLIRCAR